MFLNFLTENEKKAFLGLAHKVAMADNVLHDKEKAMMKLYEYECGIVLGDEKDNDVSSLCSMFDSRQSRIYCILELVAIALSDADYHKSEKDLVQSIALLLNIESDTLEYLNNWIIRQNNMFSEISKFIGKE
jgi:uncharacterized tellurite resistance protein B-like protein